LSNRYFEVDAGRLSAELAGLAELTLHELKYRWRTAYGNEPPPRSGKKFLIAAVAYKIQERVYGGLKPAVIRLLEQESENISPNVNNKVPPARTVATLRIRNLPQIET